MNAFQIAAFASELEKDAAVPQLLQRLWRSGIGRAVAGGAAGAAGGALANPENRLRGAILGGALGAGGGYAAPLLTQAGRRRAKEHAKYLGRKAKHEVTGRGGAPIAPSMSAKEVASLRKAERLGLTSIPGIAKGMWRRPLQTLKGAWQQAGTPGKLMAVGNLALAAPGIVDSSTPGGTAEKALGTLGSTGGYLLGGRMGLLGSSLLGGGLGYLGGKAGKLIGGSKPGQTEQHLRRPLTTYAREQVSQAVPEVGQLVGPG